MRKCTLLCNCFKFAVRYTCMKERIIYFLSIKLNKMEIKRY